MLDRGITEKKLRSVFEPPHQIKQARDGCMKLLSYVEGRLLVVVYRPTQRHDYQLITAYWKD